MLDTVFQALSDSTRREILLLLRGEERSTGALAGRFSLSRPAISKHLRVLLDAELVARRKEGRNQVYSLRPEAIAEAHAWLDGYRRFWRESLTQLKAHVESDRGRTREEDR